MASNANISAKIPDASSGESFSPPAVRFWLVQWFVYIFAATALAPFLTLFFCRDRWPEVKELLQLLLPAETALLGSAVGYYFGSMHRPPSERESDSTPD